MYIVRRDFHCAGPERIALTIGGSEMISEQLTKVIDRIKSQPQNPDAPLERRRAWMERISEHVAHDVTCEPVDAGGVPAEWIATPRPASDRHILYLHCGPY